MPASSKSAVKVGVAGPHRKLPPRLASYVEDSRSSSWLLEEMFMKRSVRSNPLGWGGFTFTSKQAHDGCDFKPAEEKWRSVFWRVNRAVNPSQTKRKAAGPSLNVSDCLEFDVFKAHKNYEVGIWLEGSTPLYDEVDPQVLDGDVDGDGDSGANEEDWTLTDFADESDLKSVCTSMYDESEAGDSGWVDVDATVKKGGFSYADAIKSLGKTGAAPRHLPFVPLEYRRKPVKGAVKKAVEEEENEVAFEDYDAAKGMRGGKGAKMFVGEGKT